MNSISKSVKVSNPITEGKIGKEMLLFFFPIFFGTLFQQVYNAVDALIVGRYLGKVALSAVGGSSGMIVMVVVGFFVGLASGASVLVAQYYGANDNERVSKAVHTVIAFSIVCGIVVTVVGILLSKNMLMWLKTPEDTMADSVVYLKVYFAGMVGNLVYNVGSGVLRAVGDSKRPFIFLVVSCVINIVLDLLFIIVFGMGIFGAALATIVAQAVSAVLVIVVMMRSKESYRLILSKVKMDTAMVVQMIRIGFPSGVQSIMYGISNLIIQISVNGLGTDYVAAWATYYKIDGVFWMVVGAFGIAGATFIGQNYGAGLIDRVKKTVRVNLVQAVVSAVLITIAVYVTCPWIFPLFSNDPVVNQIGVDMMRYLSRFYVLYISIEIISGLLRGLGDTFIPMIICAVGVCVLRSAWIIIMMPIHNNMYTMMVSYPISWVFTSIVFWIYMLKFSKLGKILRNKE